MGTRNIAVPQLDKGTACFSWLCPTLFCRLVVSSQTMEDKDDHQKDNPANIFHNNSNLM